MEERYNKVKAVNTIHKRVGEEVEEIQYDISTILSVMCHTNLPHVGDMSCHPTPIVQPPCLCPLYTPFFYTPLLFDIILLRVSTTATNETTHKCTHTYVHTHNTHIHTQHTHTYTHIHKHICVGTHICLCMYTHIHTAYTQTSQSTITGSKKRGGHSPNKHPCPHTSGHLDQDTEPSCLYTAPE